MKSIRYRDWHVDGRAGMSRTQVCIRAVGGWMSKSVTMNEQVIVGEKNGYS